MQIQYRTFVGATTNLNNGENVTLKIILEAELRKFHIVYGRTSILEHVQKYYPQSPAMQSIIDKQLLQDT